MSHGTKPNTCTITIHNIQNSNSAENSCNLVLQSIGSPIVPNGSPLGSFASSVSPGAWIAPSGTSTFVLTNPAGMAGASMQWTTGAEDTAAIIVMTFSNPTSPKDFYATTVNIEVKAQNGATDALKAYGASYFYAGLGAPVNGVTPPMTRDYVNCQPNQAWEQLNIEFYVIRNQYYDNPPTTFLPGITNVVMLMLENRSLDQLLGQIYTEDAPPAHVYPATSQALYEGLGKTPTFSNNYDGKDYVAEPVNGITDAPNPDPGEQWSDANQQAFNIMPTPVNPYSVPPAGTTPSMGGFVNNYAPLAAKKQADIKQIMQFYTPESLPVLSTLATSYAVSDAWFCSVPSQTSPNRAFSIAGTSGGYVDNYYSPGIPPWDKFLSQVVHFPMRTIFNVLTNSGNHDWCIYSPEQFPIGSLTASVFSQVKELGKQYPESIRPIDDFFDIINDGKKSLPAFCYLEPSTLPGVFAKKDDITHANDYHPPFNVLPGEQNLAEIYNALTTYKDWETTLFIVTFDEHGGTFDHVAPPATIAPDLATDWSGFGFDRLGIRVPTLLISPRIQAGTVFRATDTIAPGNVPFDHTSFLKTILGWQGIDVTNGVLGARAVQAPDFSPVLAPDVVNPGAVKLTPRKSGHVNDTDELNDHQKIMLPALAHKISGGEYGGDDHQRIFSELSSLATITDLREYLKYLI